MMMRTATKAIRHFFYWAISTLLVVELWSVDGNTRKDYDYNYQRDFGLLPQSFATDPIQPISLHKYDVTKVISSSDMTAENSILSSSMDTIDNHNFDPLQQISDDDDVVQLSFLRNRKHRNDLSSSTILQREKQKYLSKPIELALRTKPMNENTDYGMYTNSNLNQQQQQQQQNQQFKYKKTGTTIVGIAGKDYCILGADTRATSGSMVADKRCFKLHALSANCAAAGAGTSADLDHITRECYYQIQLWLSSATSSSRQSSIGNDPVTINTTSNSDFMIPIVSVRKICHYLQQRLYEQKGSCQANLIVGGVDNDIHGCGGILRAIHPGGSIDVVQYTALGSGSYAAMSILESTITDPSGYHNLTIDEAIALVVKAVKAGIDHDLGSGSQVDLCIISTSPSHGITTNYTRCYLPEEELDTISQPSTTTTTTTNDDDINTQKSNAITALYNREQILQTFGSNGFGNVPYSIVRQTLLSKHTDSTNGTVSRNDGRTNGEISHSRRWEEILDNHNTDMDKDPSSSSSSS